LSLSLLAMTCAILNRMSKLLKILFFVVFISLPAHAQDGGKLVKIRLVPERSTIKAGDEIWIGVEQAIKPGWHTYWKNPGDSGTAPRIEWDLPDGFEISDIRWPVPHKLSMGPLTNYGYEDEVVLLQKLKAPAELPEGPLAFTADIEILVCKEECIPEYGTYGLMLNGSEGEAENNTAYFKKATDLLPVPVPWKAMFKEEGNSLVINIPVQHSGPQDIAFVPEDWGLVLNSATSEVERKKDGFILRQKRGERSLNSIQQIKGLLTYSGKDFKPFTYAFTAQKESASMPGEPAPDKPAFLQILVFALFGGLILNLMPCVFPVLSIKALSLVKTSEKQPRLAQLHGLSYTAGVVLSFLTIAGILIALRASGAEIGWGFQLQNTTVVTLLAWLLFIIGLNLCGLFEVSGHLGNIGNKLTQGEGLKNSFFTGILATLVATPCTAPFMAAAIGAALILPAYAALIIFAALGFGLALPYLALAYMPSLQKKLPKPGAWMDTFKQLLAFPMFASAAWLLWVLSQQAGSIGVFGGLMGLVLIAFGIWLLRHTPQKRYWRYKVRILALVSFIAAFLMIPAAEMTPPATTKNAFIFGEVFTPETLQQKLATKAPVFVEMTAAWCITCKVNHAIALNIDSTKKVFADNDVQYLVGDWTNQDARITEYLNSFGRNGVPIYVFYGRPDPATGKRPEPEVLPQLLTPGIVASYIEN
jgi:thiol:disulfide interchange protein